MAFQNRGIDFDPPPKRHLDDVAALVADVLDVVGLGDDPLGEEETRGQLAVIARCPHGDRDHPRRPASGDIGGEADLQWFLDGKRVREAGGGRAGNFLHGHANDPRAWRNGYHVVPSRVEAVVLVTLEAVTSTPRCFMSGWSLWAL